MNFDKVKSLSEDFAGVFDGGSDSKEYPVPSMDPVKGKLSYKLTINLLKDKGSSSISGLKFNNTDIMVDIKAEKANEEY
jgi:hypothetical protein